MQRRILATTVVGAVVASAAGGWIAGSTLRSPADVAADAAPPPPSLITAPVERRELTSLVTGRGTVRYGEPTSVTLASSGAEAGGGGLVTRAPEVGDELAEDAVALEIAGRPVRVLEGDVPMYRDIRPGDTGEDVRQLEAALARLGHDPGAVDGVYDLATQSAVIAWYEASGYDAQGATDAEEEQLRSAQQAISSAEDQVLQATNALRAASKGATAADIEQAQADIRGRGRDVESSTDQLARAQAAEAPTRTAEANARTALDDAALSSQIQGVQAQADVEAAQNRVDEAATAKGLADTKLQTDLTTYADDPSTPVADVKRVASDAQIAQDQASVQQAGNNLAQAQTALDLARLRQTETVDKQESSLRQAQSAVDQAVAAVSQAESNTRSAQRALDAANDAVVLAQLRLTTLQSPPDTASARASLDKAKRDLDQASQRGGELLGEVGIVVPANEVIFQPTLPVRVDEATVERGEAVQSEVMVVTTSRLAVDGALSIPDAKLVSVGDEVELTATDLGVTVTGTVTELAAKPGTNGVDAQKVYLEITPTDPPVELVGAAVGLKITVTSTGGEVLAVPVAAVSVSSDGETRVQVANADGTTRAVPVTTGLSAEGFVEVTSDGLAAGDEVVVGNAGATDLAEGSDT